MTIDKGISGEAGAGADAAPSGGGGDGGAFLATEGPVEAGSNVRVGDADRDAVAAQLRDHYADGRLTHEELNERLDQAFAAKTTADLNTVMRDLPHVSRPFADTPAAGAWQGRAWQEPPADGGRGSGSPIEFRLDTGSGVPTYLQLVQQVEHALRLGYLKPGDQLPKVRDVVSSLAINPNTVLKAYRELETKGLAAGRPGQGTFVQATLSQVALPELTVLRRTLMGWLGTADAAGLDEDGIVALFTSALRDFHERRGRPGGRRGAAGDGETEGVA
jgi:DNA-binding transcriptional regulator YhcF (GntR family)